MKNLFGYSRVLAVGDVTTLQVDAVVNVINYELKDAAL